MNFTQAQLQAMELAAADLIKKINCYIKKKEDQLSIQESKNLVAHILFNETWANLTKSHQSDSSKTSELQWFDLTKIDIFNASRSLISKTPPEAKGFVSQWAKVMVETILKIIETSKPDGSILPFSINEVATPTAVTLLIEHHYNRKLSVSISTHLSRWLPQERSSDLLRYICSIECNELIIHFLKSAVSEHSLDKTSFDCLNQFIAWQDDRITLLDLNGFLPLSMARLIMRSAKIPGLITNYQSWLERLNHAQALAFIKGSQLLLETAKLSSGLPISPPVDYENLILSTIMQSGKLKKNCALGEVVHKIINAFQIKNSSTISPRLEPLLKAKNTYYGEHIMRSRLEAKFAMLFDYIHLPWRYEPDVYKTSIGSYLPDFFIRGLDCYVEIKPASPSVEELQKIIDVAHITNKTVALISDFPDNDGSSFSLEQSTIYLYWPNQRALFTASINDWLFYLDKETQKLLWHATKHVSDSHRGGFFQSAILGNDILSNEKIRKLISQFSSCNRSQRLKLKTPDSRYYQYQRHSLMSYLKGLSVNKILLQMLRIKYSQIKR